MAHRAEWGFPRAPQTFISAHPDRRHAVLALRIWVENLEAYGHLPHEPDARIRAIRPLDAANGAHKHGRDAATYRIDLEDGRWCYARARMAHPGEEGYGHGRDDIPRGA